MRDIHARRESLGAHVLGGRLDDAAGRVDFPPVVDAAQAVALGARQQERCAPVRAQLVEEADAAVVGAERDVVLAEEPNGHWSGSRFEVVRDRERDPIVLAHEPTERRVTVDTGHQFVLGSRRHGLAFAVGVMEGAR